VHHYPRLTSLDPNVAWYAHLVTRALGPDGVQRDVRVLPYIEPRPAPQVGITQSVPGFQR
jgi:hypothetical protein